MDSRFKVVLFFLSSNGIRFLNQKRASYSESKLDFKTKTLFCFKTKTCILFLKPKRGFVFNNKTLFLLWKQKRAFREFVSYFCFGNKNVLLVLKTKTSFCFESETFLVNKNVHPFSRFKWFRYIIIKRFGINVK